MHGTKRDRDRERERERRPSMPRPRRPRIVHCVAVAAVILLALVGVLILVFWLVVRPSLLRYSVEKAHVQGFNLTGNTLSATFNLTIDARNPNRKVSVYYDRVDVAVWYGGQMLAFNEVAPFYQPQGETRALKVDAAARSTPLLGSVSASLKRERAAGATAVEVRVRSWVRFKVGLLKTDHYILRAYCSPVVVRFSASSPAKFEKIDCDVDI